MKLHHNNEDFSSILDIVSAETNIDKSIITKDYFVTLFLKELKKNYPEYIFKGGTSLSKCFKIINRFSEDIDLSYYVNNDENIPITKIKKANYGIKSTIEELGFTFINESDFKSGRKFQQFNIEVPFSQNGTIVREYIIVENSLLTKSFPVVEKSIESIVATYLKGVGREDIIEEYSLDSFLVNSQDIVRTFIDKVYAICDYYLEGKSSEYGRHIYDIHKLYVEIGEPSKYIELIQDIREERKNNIKSISIIDNHNISELLDEIIKEDFYKKDFNSNTINLLYETISYEEVIYTLQKISTKNIF